jgi:DNA-binding NarL/FixJ family response regulator
MASIKIMLVDDHSLVREGINAMLSSYSDLEIIAEAENGSSAIEKLSKFEPDLMLIDINMPGMDGLELSERIVELYPTIKIIILSMDVSITFVKRAIQAGVRGYIPKDSQREILVEAIRKVFQGEKYFSEKVSKVILQGFYNDNLNDKVNQGNSDLTKREEEILICIATGMPNRDIAEKLFISNRTVDAHRNHIIQKLKVKTTADLVRYAIKNKLIELE